MGRTPGTHARSRYPLSAETHLRWRDQTLELRRRPEDPELRAWDAADLYALDHFVQEVLPQIGPGPLLLVEDVFGALACALARVCPERDRVVWADSVLSERALRANERANGNSAPARFVPSDLRPEGSFAAAIVKVVRETARLEHYLSGLPRVLVPGAPVLGAGMTRHVHRSTVRAFETRIGPTRTTLARQKARLLSALAESKPTGPGVWPAPPRITVAEGLDFELVGYPGVFASGRLDAGTALLLRHLPRWPEGGEGRRFVDLGSGSGALAVAMARSNPRAEGTAIDASHLAVRSTRETAARAGVDRLSVRPGDGVEGVADRSVDLVLSNPPQHQHAVVSQRLLGHTLEALPRILRPGGRVRMVANRHVNLNVALQEILGRVRILEQDRQFMVCEAQRLGHPE